MRSQFAYFDPVIILDNYNSKNMISVQCVKIVFRNKIVFSQVLLLRKFFRHALCVALRIKQNLPINSNVVINQAFTIHLFRSTKQNCVIKNYIM